MPGAVSLRPSSFTNASKFTDINVEFTKAVFAETAYADGTETFAFIANLTDLDDGGEHEQLWSMGAISSWSASDDGLDAIPTKDGGTIKKTSNFGMLMQSLVDAGFPEDKIENAGSLVGLRVHLAAKAIKDNNGERTVPVVGKILSLPWEKKKSTGAAKVKPNTSTAAAAAPVAAPTPAALSDEVKSLVDMAVMAVVVGSEGELEKKKLNAKVMKLIQSDTETYPKARHGAIMAAVAKDDVLRGIEGISYDGALLKAE